MPEKRIIGVYRIYNSITQKVYIGSSININKRILEHKNSLTKNKHHSILLQKSWNKHGSDNFIFEIIEIFESIKNKKELLDREQFYIDSLQSYNPNYGYNMLKKADNSLGVIRSKESRKKQSIKMSGAGNPNYNKSRTNEHSNKIILSRTGKNIIDRQEVIKDFLDGMNTNNISKKYKCHKATICRILRQNGVKNSNVKLNLYIANEIREKYKTNNYSFEDLAKLYNVSDSTINEIINYKRWIS